MASPTIAANAYAALAKLTTSTVGASPPAGAASASFGDALRSALSGVVESAHKADAQAQAMAAGKSNLVDVVTAVSETEVALQTLVSVRDRVIQSYEEIMRMPI